jgi:hypothetical protein
MATVNLGSIKFKWKGTYAGGTAYTVDDVVSYNGSSYICILASTGNLPTNATYFEQMSSAGTNGTDLTTTLTTQGDLVYRDGSGLQRLGAGTSGQVLQTGGTGANPSWVDASSGSVLKVYTKMWYGSKSLTGTISNGSAVAVSDYDITITPQSDTSKFLINWTISGSNDDHRFFQLRRSIGGATATNIGLGISSLANSNTFNDWNSFFNLSTTNSYPSKTNIFFDAPATASSVKYQLYHEGHGGTFYFGRSHNNSGTAQYASLNSCSIFELDGSSITNTYINNN